MYERPIFDVIILVATVDVNPCQEVHSPHAIASRGNTVVTKASVTRRSA